MQNITEEPGCSPKLGSGQAHHNATYVLYPEYSKRGVWMGGGLTIILHLGLHKILF